MTRTLYACLLLLAGCVTPEAPPAPRPRPAAQAEPRRMDLEPAPLANRSLRAPPNASNINLEIPPILGTTPKPATSTPAVSPSPDPARPATR